jgi:hypothetical protein
MRVVVHDQTCVAGAAHVELGCVTAHLRGASEGLDRVLGFGLRGAAVRDDLHRRASVRYPHHSKLCPCEQEGFRNTKDPLVFMTIVS